MEYGPDGTFTINGRPLIVIPEPAMPALMG